MKTVTINKGEELTPNLNGFTHFWLNEIVREDETVITKVKPTYPSEFDAKDPLRCNFNYDGTTPTIVFDPETKKLKASGWGYTKLTLTFVKE
uniref:Uncharacterized protein n=1 Tax=Pantoea phage Survivor TaxID=3232176 RepID=A0AAU8KXT9_9CAUD